MTKREDEDLEELEARVSAAGRQLGAFGAASEAELRELRDAVRARAQPRARLLPRWALATSLAAGLAALVGLAVALGPALRSPSPGARDDEADPVLALMEEVTDIAYPGSRADVAGDASPYEDQLAEVADWLVVGAVEENAGEDYPGAYEWLDSVLSNELEDEVL